MSTSPSTCNTGRETQEQHRLELGAKDIAKSETRRICRQLEHLPQQPRFVDPRTFDDHLILKCLLPIAESDDDVDVGDTLISLLVHGGNALLRRKTYFSRLAPEKWQNNEDASREIKSDPWRFTHHVVVTIQDAHPEWWGLAGSEVGTDCDDSAAEAASRQFGTSSM